MNLGQSACALKVKESSRVFVASSYSYLLATLNLICGFTWVNLNSTYKSLNMDSKTMVFVRLKVFLGECSDGRFLLKSFYHFLSPPSISILCCEKKKCFGKSVLRCVSLCCTAFRKEMRGKKTAAEKKKKEKEAVNSSLEEGGTSGEKEESDEEVTYQGEENDGFIITVNDDNEEGEEVEEDVEEVEDG